MRLEEVKSDSHERVEPEGFDTIGEIQEEDIDPALLELVPLAFAKGNLVLPMRRVDGTVLVAIADPGKIFALDDIAKLLSSPVTPVFAEEGHILDAIHRLYDRPSGSAHKVIGDIDSESLESLATEWEEPKDLLEFTDEAPIIRLLNSLLFQAVKERASDIHIEPYERQVEARFRVDGLLYPAISIKKSIQEAIVSRVKVMAGLDIAEKRLPQDGRIRLLIAGRDVDVRVSTVPTSFGERVALRLLDRKGGVISFDSLGLTTGHERVMDSILKRSSGILLVTGPTGSGKTTTLYGALNRINSTERNIITVEDPVEYQLKGIGQIQVNPKVGLTFVNGLRSILRQDPDVIMVGEIRDRETAEIAIHASLTGHLVISTIHTNDAPTAVTRLVEMGIERFLVASSLAAVVAQRLVRLLCPHCKSEYIPEPEERSLFKEDVPRLWRAVGCKRCFDTGYHGRVGIFELLVVEDDMHSIILKNPDAVTLREHALGKGMGTLREDGLAKVRLGITTLDEVLRATHLT